MPARLIPVMMFLAASTFPSQSIVMIRCSLRLVSNDCLASTILQLVAKCQIAIEKLYVCAFMAMCDVHVPASSRNICGKKWFSQEWVAKFFLLLWSNVSWIHLTDAILSFAVSIFLTLCEGRYWKSGIFEPSQKWAFSRLQLLSNFWNWWFNTFYLNGHLRSNSADYPNKHPIILQ